MAKYEIKISVDARQAIVPTQEVAKNLDKVTESAKKTEKALDAHEKTTTKLTGSKKKLVDGLKKLGNEIPGVGVLLHALKNPFTLLGVSAAAAAAAVHKVVEEVNALEAAETALNSFNNVQKSTLELQAKLLTSAIAFNEELGKIAPGAKTGADHLKELNDQLARRFEIEEAGAKPLDPAAADAARRRRVGGATALFNAGTFARDRADAAQAQLPGAEAELLAAQSALSAEESNQGRAGVLDAARRTKAEEKVTAATRGLLGLEELRPSIGSEDPRSYFQVRRAHYQGQLDAGLSEVQQVDTSNDARRALLEQLRRPVSAAGRKVEELRKAVLTGREQFQEFRGGAATAFQQSNAMTLVEDPGQAQRIAGQQQLDRRVDAILESLKKFQVGVDARTALLQSAHAKAASQNAR